MEVVFAHFAHFGGQQSHFRRVELLVGAPWWPSEVLTILRYPNHNYKIASVPKIRFVQFLRRANALLPTKSLIAGPKCLLLLESVPLAELLSMQIGLF